MREIFKGATSQTEYFSLRSATTGLGLTGKVFGDVTGSYTRMRAARTAITMATLGSASAAYSSGGFIEVDATNCPGLYRFDIPDAAFATGVDKVIVTIKVTGAIEEHKEFQLVDWNKQVAAIPNVAAAANGGLATVDANNAVKVQSGTGANQISLSSGLVDITQTAADKVWASTTRTLSAFSTALAVSVWDVLASAVATASSIGLQLKTNIDATISSRASSAALATVQADTDDIQTRLPAALVSGRMDASVGAVAANAITAAAIATDAIGSAQLAATAATEVANAVMATTLPELTQALPPTTPTVAQALVMPWMELTNQTTSTSTLKSVRNRAGTVIYKCPLSDSAGTFTKDVAQSGP